MVKSIKIEKEKLCSFFDLSDVVLVTWSYNLDFTLSYISKSIERLLGFSQSELENQHRLYVDCIHKDDHSRVSSELNLALEKKHTTLTHQPYRVVTKENATKWVLNHTFVIKNEKDNALSFMAYITDITELKTSELNLRHLSQTDALTKLHNRLFIDKILQEQYYRFKRNRESCGLILIDIDSFKDVNDTFGHLQGDILLVEFAKFLKNSVREGDFVSRWGGEEFLIVLPHTNLVETTVIAKKIHTKLQSNTFSVVKRKTASFGVSELKSGQSIKDTFISIDKALYRSKRKGKNTISIA